VPDVLCAILHPSLSLRANIHTGVPAALAWSPAVPGTAQDLSLLALGHRSGDVTLWQCVCIAAPLSFDNPLISGMLRLDDERKPVRVARFRPQDETNVLGALRWSDWTLSTAGAFRTRFLIARSPI